MAGKGAQGFADSPTPVKVMLGVLIVGVLGAVYYAALHMTLSEELSAAEVKQAALLKEKQAAEEQRAEYLRLRTELRDRETIDRINKRVLPDNAEMAAVLQDLNRLAEVSGLTIKSVHPRPERKEDMYVRIPVQLSLKGRFHQVARFLYNTSRLERVINMENLALGSPKAEGDEVHLNIEVRATTFRRPSAADSSAKKKGKKK